MEELKGVTKMYEMLSSTVLSNFRRYLDAGRPLPAPAPARDPLGAFDERPRRLRVRDFERGGLFAFDEEPDESPPMAGLDLLCMLARSLSAEAWAGLQQRLCGGDAPAAPETVDNARGGSRAADVLPTYKKSGMPNNYVDAERAADGVLSLIRNPEGGEVFPPRSARHAMLLPSRPTPPTAASLDSELAFDRSPRSALDDMFPGLASRVRVGPFRTGQ